MLAIALRVNLYGNVCNNPYVVAKFLRLVGVEAHLFLERGFPWLPEHDDPELERGYPDWIHVIGDLRLRRYGVLDSRFVRRFGDCDVIHTCYWGPIWAQKTGRPFVFQPYGGDLNVLPFMTDSLHHRYLAARQRQGILAADALFLANPHGRFCQDAVHRLRLSRLMYMPLPVDTDRFKPLPAEEIRHARAAYGADWILFHPTRQVWTDTSSPWERKGNDRVFRAFARFLRDTHRRALLIAVAHGPDLQASQQLVKELGIERAVHWIPPQRRFDLIRLYNMADAVVDQFVCGYFGGCAFEAWSCGTPVFIHLESFEGTFGEEPPAINVRTEDEIFSKFAEYTDGREALAEVGEESRRWVLEHLDGSVLVKRYIAAYERVLATR